MDTAEPDWSAILEPPSADGKPSFTPRVGSEPYTRKDYWEHRFSREDSYEWLCRYALVKDLVNALVPDRASRILVVGSGNSSLPLEMSDDGYTDILSTDYSEAVIERMSARAASSHPSVRWAVADMTNLAGLGDGSFDVVIDKAAMDAIIADGGDTWDPPEHLLAVAERIMGETARVLAPGGAYLQLSFAQPHFRKKYLTQVPGRWESLKALPVNAGLGYLLYVARKPAADTESS